MLRSLVGSECKKDLEEALAMMAGAGLDTARLWAEIKDRVIGHTLAGLHPILALSYEAAFGDRADRSRCYQVLGFDVMLDEGGRPFLLEINANPSFAVPTPLDLRVKGSVLANTIVEVLGTEPVWDQCSGLLPLESDHIDVPKLGDHEAVLSEALTLFQKLRSRTSAIGSAGLARIKRAVDASDLEMPVAFQIHNTVKSVCWDTFIQGLVQLVAGFDQEERLARLRSFLQIAATSV
eukprot:TRINITY_DN43817_c0_g1_i4.p1 TRINITY_DN43817_c0_g1~~TRINITY_DN43817_c0_g1_i4.p1  ORF type:complete len:236 (-),score=47.61 TRINITY_DN43817_c0_g1_i4:168-875(-)